MEGMANRGENLKNTVTTIGTAFFIAAFSAMALVFVLIISKDNSFILTINLLCTLVFSFLLVGFVCMTVPSLIKCDHSTKIKSLLDAMLKSGEFDIDNVLDKIKTIYKN
jgi:archaellum biogenesis protein FlaJ (TadC family)